MKRISICVLAILTILSFFHLSRAQQSVARVAAEDPFGEPAATVLATDLPAIPGAEALKVQDTPVGSPPHKALNSSENASEINRSQEIEARLSLPENVEYLDTPLQDVVDHLSMKLAIPFVLDKKALEEAGIGTDKTINVSLRGIPLDKALDLILRELELTWVVRDGYVLITTNEKVSELQEVRVYNCSDLIELIKLKPKSTEGGMMGGQTGFGVAGFGVAGFPAGFSPMVPPGTVTTMGAIAAQPAELVPDSDSLIQLIQTTVEPDSWQDLGGLGSIESYHGGLLVVSQDPRTHRRVEVLLKIMRQAKQAQPGTVVRER